MYDSLSAGRSPRDDLPEYDRQIELITFHATLYIPCIRVLPLIGAIFILHAVRFIEVHPVSLAIATCNYAFRNSGTKSSTLQASPCVIYCAFLFYIFSLKLEHVKD